MARCAVLLSLLLAVGAQADESCNADDSTALLQQDPASLSEREREIPYRTLNALKASRPIFGVKAYGVPDVDYKTMGDKLGELGLEDVARKATEIAMTVWGGDEVHDGAAKRLSADVKAMLRQLGKGRVEEVLPGALSQFFVKASHSLVTPVVELAKGKAAGVVQEVAQDPSYEAVLGFLNKAITMRKGLELAQRHSDDKSEQMKAAVSVARELLDGSRKVSTAVDEGALVESFDGLEATVTEWLKEHVQKWSKLKAMRLKERANQDESDREAIKNLRRAERNAAPAPAPDQDGDGNDREDSSMDVRRASAPAPAPAPDRYD